MTDAFFLEKLMQSGKNTMLDHLGIEFITLTHELVSAKMPVDARTVQPYGILHGGASAALAETLGSVGAIVNVDPETTSVVGTNLTINHIRSARDGWVTGEAVPIHIGLRSQVWSIQIRDDENRLISDARLTLAILPRK